jgi:hypothetical protein
MIYHRYCIVGYLLWIRYALFKGRILRTLDYIYAHYLESPGTKAFSKKGAAQLFKNYSIVKITTMLSFGDLLLGEVGQRHRSVVLSMLKKVWPRTIIKALCSKHGGMLLIEAIK